jgi:molybdopterin-guanine dinucleotide biosynthesis protein A
MCGGQSKRMGTDKGLIPIKDSCWAAYMADKLADINLPVSVSINISQLHSYEQFFSVEKLILDGLDFAGPLNGLLSARLKYPDNDLLLLACDMISMQTKTLCRLIDIYRSEPFYDFYVYQNKEFAEPFCGIYTANGLSNTSLQLDISKQTSLSMQNVLNNGYTKRLPITEDQSFENNNTL